MRTKTLKNGEKTAHSCTGVPRDAKGRFVKGCRGGTGRPKIPEEMKQAFRAAAPDACRVLIGIVNDESAANKDRIRAAEIILDRGYGKPVQAVDLEGDINAVPVSISFEGVLAEWSK